MNRILLLLLLTVLGLFYSCKNDQLTQTQLDAQLEQTLNNAASQIYGEATYTKFLMPESGDFSNLLQDWEHNPLTAEKVQLGRFLFFETGLALDAVHQEGMETYSCGSCHVPQKGFVPGQAQGIADGGIGFVYDDNYERVPFNPSGNTGYADDELDVQGARPLSMLNSAFVTNSTWAGAFGSGGVNEGMDHLFEGLQEVNKLGFAGLESQNIEGLHVHRMRPDKATFDSLGYVPLFDSAFPDIPESERYSDITTSFALSAYIRSLLPNEAPFQKWLKGDRTAMSDQEKEGAILFFRKAGCSNCHKSPGLNAMEFYAVGVKDLYETTGNAYNVAHDDKRHLGRGGFTGERTDEYKFKVPQLYNLKDARFYFHGSSKRSLREVVEYFNEGKPENTKVHSDNISSFFRPLNLDEDEIDALTAFLETGLYDADLQRYVPESILSGNCFPNNDEVSAIQMGCIE